MVLFCLRGHNQTHLPAMGGLCEVCLKEDPESFSCKNTNCPDAVKGQHFHPPEDVYFLDADGNRVE